MGIALTKRHFLIYLSSVHKHCPTPQYNFLNTYAQLSWGK